MPLDARSSARPHIAIVGAGITGLAAALDLARHARVTLIEAEPRLGGHARTVLAGRHGNQPVDTGFIVFNHATYPHLSRLFADLDVPIEKSDMSFGVSLDGGGFEYALRSPGSLFAQRRRAVDPRFLRMIADILRFNARAEAVAEAAPEDMTLDELLDTLGMGRWFRSRYLRPLTGAIWSTPEAQMGAFPARALIRFMRNHALMSAGGQHQWFTVSGGSASYVRRIAARLRDEGVDIRTASPVRRIMRNAGRAAIRLERGGVIEADHVILAVHADVALKLLDAPTPAERRLLGAIRFQNNRAVLHADPALMPKRRAVWSSWVYQARRGADADRLGVTYWMNRLQNIPEDDPLFVTLNPVREPRAETVFDEHVFRHPVFDAAALAAQRALPTIQGRNGTWFAGAWARNGFHEDGIAAARRVSRALLTEIAGLRAADANREVA